MPLRVSIRRVVVQCVRATGGFIYDVPVLRSLGRRLVPLVPGPLYRRMVRMVFGEPRPPIPPSVQRAMPANVEEWLVSENAEWILRVLTRQSEIAANNQK